MTNPPFIPILGPFRGDQLVVALSAVCPKGRTTITYNRRDWETLFAAMTSRLRIDTVVDLD